MNKEARTAIAWNTLEIIKAGQYKNAHQQTVDISADMQYAIDNSKHYKPEDFEAVFIERDKLLADLNYVPIVEVTTESTFDATRRLVVEEGLEQVCCLNFASAKNPGGGFLGGAQAQEESLSRSSGLYACIEPHKKMYSTNRAFRSCLYTDNMIYSPLVPVFRNEQGALLDKHYLVSVLTVPAVNAGVVRDNEPENAGKIAPVMLSRMEKLLSVAIVQKQTTLVLGAWGCGVFRNNVADVARWFGQQLQSDTFKHAFSRIVFAVYDTSKTKNTIDIFRANLPY